METKDLTIDDFIKKSAKLVIVKHAENNFSTFLVSDEENPDTPGYPACCLTYYNSLKKARKDIKATYKRVGYKPKYPDFGYWTSKLKKQGLLKG